MAQTTLLPLQTNPFSLGATLPTAGAPVKITNYLAVTLGWTDLASANAQCFKSMIIEALPSNSGSVYVLNSSAAADKVHYSNVLFVITPGGVYNPSAYAMGPISINNIWLDVDVSGEGAIASVYMA